jgi:uncharacterized protein (DUF486 family)
MRAGRPGAGRFGLAVAAPRRTMPRMTTLVLLCLSNIFMTYAWYGHLKYHGDKPLWVAILISWGIAFFEYCLMVPANRLGYGRFTGYELKIIQEVVTLVVFVGFASLVLDEKLRWNYAVSLLLLALAVFFAFGVNRPAGPAA